MNQTTLKNWTIIEFVNQIVGNYFSTWIICQCHSLVLFYCIQLSLVIRFFKRFQYSVGFNIFLIVLLSTNNGNLIRFGSQNQSRFNNYSSIFYKAIFDSKIKSQRSKHLYQFDLRPTVKSSARSYLNIVIV